MKASGFLAKVSLVAVFVLVAIGAIAQTAEVGLAKNVIDAAATKDFVWIVSFIAALSLVLNFYLVRLMFGMIEKLAGIVVKNTEAMGRFSHSDQEGSHRREKRYSDETPHNR